MAEITAKVRRDVYERDNWQCQGCGASLLHGWRSIQHRKARGQGGGNEMTNLISLCGSATSPGCHRRCEDRDETMHERGLWIASWEDETATPVTRFDGTKAWLLRCGTFSYDPP